MKITAFDLFFLVFLFRDSKEIEFLLYSEIIKEYLMENIILFSKKREEV